VDGRWYLVAAFFPAVILLVANSLSRWSLPHHSPTFPPLNAPGVLIAVAIAVVANPWEEVGWRGFALTRLQVNHNASLAAFIVGVLWALWHIPLFLWPGSLMSRSPFWVWSVAVIGESFLFAWLYNSAGQSLAVVALFHVSWNTCAAAAGVDSPLVLTAVTICAVLAILLAFGTTLAGEKTSDRTKDRCASSLN
jgi:membrane protease YdiL (CAAX protease family)